MNKGATNIPVNVARIQGVYDDYIILTDQTYHQQDNTNLGKNVIMMDSYDGAEHKNTNEKRTSIIFFSSQMFSKDTTVSGGSTAKNLNILTWQQI